MRLLNFLAISIIFLGCKEGPGEKSEINTKDTTEFFQVSQYIQSQVDDVLKTPYFIYEKNTYNNKEDSFAITSQQFEKIAQKFLTPDINDPKLKKEYIETAFLDQTTKTYTLNYTTKNRDLEIQNIDVLLKDDASTIKRIFIRKFFNYNNDSSAIEQLDWVPNEQFQVSRLVQEPGLPERETRTTVAWNVKK